jgi:mannose-6-phosphate isomerase-like protein (cupin superfamily)
MSDDRLFATLPIKRVPKPWGYELIFARTERYVGKILHINRGESLSLQYHEIKEETLFVVTGELRLTIEVDGDRRDLRLQSGEAFHIAADVPGWKRQRYEDVAEVSTPELDDVIRPRRCFGRTSTSAP